MVVLGAFQPAVGAGAGAGSGTFADLFLDAMAYLGSKVVVDKVKCRCILTP